MAQEELIIRLGKAESTTYPTIKVSGGPRWLHGLQYYDYLLWNKLHAAFSVSYQTYMHSRTHWELQVITSEFEILFKAMRNARCIR